MKSSGVLGFLKGGAVDQLDLAHVDQLALAGHEIQYLSARLSGLLRPVRGVRPHASPELLSELRSALADALARVAQLTGKR